MKRSSQSRNRLEKKAGKGRRSRKIRPAQAAAVNGAARPQSEGRAPKVRSGARRPSEHFEDRKVRARRILEILRRVYPDAECALKHRSALELLVSTILSAQCTDVRVNMVTPALFARYPDAASFAAADPSELEEMIRSTGFFRNKTRSLIGMGRTLVERFGGRVPDRMEDLLTLPGVARKTANCVLGTWFRKNEGIVVDTHVGRLASRLGLLSSARDDKDAVKVESDLMPLFPNDSWTFLSHALIDHGRQICAARKPVCETCPLRDHCPKLGVGSGP